MRESALDRIRSLHRSLEENRLVQAMVGAAGGTIGKVQICVALYRQSCFRNLARNGASGVGLQNAPAIEGRWISESDRRQFQADGYMAIRNVIPASLFAPAVREIAAFVGADLADRTTWYRGPRELDGIVPLHHAQSLWEIRQCPNLYQVFSEFFGNPRLMVDINRCIFRPPVNPRLPKISRGSLHWDTDPRGPAPASLQAVVLLSDVGRDGGGFQCLPDVYQNLDAWLTRHARADDFNFFYPGLNRWESTQVEGNAGDVILWSSKLPHGSTINLSNRPRIGAFISMQPCSGSTQLRESMMNWWRTKRAPDCWRGLPGQLDPEPGPAGGAHGTRIEAHRSLAVVAAA